MTRDPLENSRVVNLARDHQWKVKNVHDEMARLESDTGKALGLMMTRFTFECRAFKDINKWSAELNPTEVVEVDGSQIEQPVPGYRIDYLFRDVWKKFKEVYQPNQQIAIRRLEDKLKELTDANMSFAQFKGKFLSICDSLQHAGREEDEGRLKDLIRTNVTNPHLQGLKKQMYLDPTDKSFYTLDNFWDACRHVLSADPTMDTGRAAPLISGRAAQVERPRGQVDMAKVYCSRCGNQGHAQKDQYGNPTCHAATCVLCHASMGTGPHDARSCCAGSARVDWRAGWPARIKGKARTDQPAHGQAYKPRGHGRDVRVDPGSGGPPQKKSRYERASMARMMEEMAELTTTKVLEKVRANQAGNPPGGSGGGGSA